MEEENRRVVIIHAAAKLFREKGYDNTRTKDIADAVGMRSGGPFYHFKSKQEILYAVMEVGLRRALAATEEISQRDDSPIGKLRALVRAHLASILEQEQDASSVQLYEWRSLEAEGQQRLTSMKDRYTALWQVALTELERSGQIRDGGPTTLLLLFGALNWCAQWYRHSGPLTLDELTDHALRVFLPTAHFE